MPKRQLNIGTIQEYKLLVTENMSKPKQRLQSGKLFYSQILTRISHFYQLFGIGNSLNQSNTSYNDIYEMTLERFRPISEKTWGVNLTSASVIVGFVSFGNPLNQRRHKRFSLTTMTIIQRDLSRVVNV